MEKKEHVKCFDSDHTKSLWMIEALPFIGKKFTINSLPHPEGLIGINRLPSGHENKGNNPQQKMLLIVKEILLVSTFGNVQRTVCRIWILMLGCKGLRRTHVMVTGEC